MLNSGVPYPRGLATSVLSRDYSVQLSCFYRYRNHSIMACTPLAADLPAASYIYTSRASIRDLEQTYVMGLV
jgi:hypothetical protein